MRFKIFLSPTLEPSVIPINYQYPLSAAIYKVLHKADSDYAAFLHKKGYRAAGSLKNFKFFTFSDLSVKFKLKGDRMCLHSSPELVVSFHLPAAAETFVKGLFLSQQLDIADRKSRASFKVGLVNALPDPFSGSHADEVISIRVAAASACVAGWKDSKGNYDFISPEDARFPWVVQHNWEEKLKSVHIYEAGDVLGVRVLPFQTPPKSRLITIKAFTNCQTRIKGFTHFGMELTAKRKYLELIYNSGAGVYNALGMGFIEMARGR